MNFKRFHESRNLFPQSSFSGKSYGVMNYFNTASEDIVFESGQYTFSCDISTEATGGIFKICFTYTDDTQTKTGWISKSSNIQLTSNTGKIVKSITITDYNLYTDIVISNIMLNTGSQSLPYEPYSSEVWHDTPHYIHKTDTDTITTLPADIYANDTTATVGLKGNMSQSSQPSPTTPIQPSECGERTENLWNEDFTGIMQDVITYLPLNVGNGDYTLSSTVTREGQAAVLFLLAGNVSTGATTVNDGVWSGQSRTVTAVGGYVTIGYRKYPTANPENANTMLNSGSTAKPYEPYGYKIPISSASTTTPVYLGEVQTTRQIKKLVLTGQEATWYKSGTYQGSFYLGGVSPEPISLTEQAYCSHAEFTSISTYAKNKFCFNGSPKNLNLWIGESSWTADDFKTYLAQQYSAGTPVTIWYVLATETTGIVNEPIRKIGDYADTISGITIPTITGKDTFDVDTTLKPSEVSLAYTGWHDASVGEWDGSQWE